MCNTRAYRYSCGHASFRHVSSCRGTYADPRGVVVLCNGAPDLTVSIDGCCTSCQYKQFRETWEARLADAQEKRFVAMQMMREFEEGGANCAEDFGDDNALFGSGGCSTTDIFGDADLALREQQKADAELTRLKEQYEHEAITRWSSYLKGSQRPSMGAKLRRLRTPAPKSPGSSPLKNEKTFAQMAMEAQAEEEYERRLSTGMSRSPSLTSDSSEESTDWSEDGELYQSPESFLPPNDWTLPDVTFEKNDGVIGLGIKDRTVETVIVDEDEDPMFPDYGF